MRCFGNFRGTRTPVRCAALGTEFPGHHQKQLTKTLTVEFFFKAHILTPIFGCEKPNRIKIVELVTIPVVQGCSAWAEIKMTVVDTCCDLVKREFPSIDEDLFQYVKGKRKKKIRSVTEFVVLYRSSCIKQKRFSIESLG